MNDTKSILILLIVILASFVHAEEKLDINIALIEKEISPEDPLRFQVQMFRTGEKREDIDIRYYIVNNDKTQFVKSESIAIEKIGSFFREIDLPPRIQIGKNTLLIQAKIREITTEAQETFNIIKPAGFIEWSNQSTIYLFIILITVIFLFALFMIWDYKLTYRLLKAYSKIDEIDLRDEL